jgi:signal transduction histidine kinase
VQEVVVTQRTLQREALARELAEATLTVQRTQRVDEALRAGGVALEALGFDVAIVEFTPSKPVVRYLTQRASLAELVRGIEGGLQERTSLWSDRGRWDMGANQAMFIGDLRRSVARWLVELGVSGEVRALVSSMRAKAVVTPLSNPRNISGVMVFMHDELSESDLALLSLFALQIGSWLGVVEGLERLDRRTAELELVHLLAVSSTRADVNDLCQRALLTVCKNSGADAGVLHRFEEESGEFVMVGEALGYQGPLVDRYRRFSIPAESPLKHVAVSTAVSEMPEGAGPVGAAGFAFAAIVPLVVEDRSVGILSLFRRQPVAFGEADLRNAEILGLQVASLLERQRLVLESQRLYADLKRSYDELARAQQEVVRHERLAALGELAAVMAHEVRNPLGVIFNSLTTLKRIIKPSGDAEMLLNMVGEEADRLNRIVADLLDFARPYELVKKLIAVEPFIEAAVDAAIQTFPASASVVVERQFERDLPRVPIDAHLLRQALINLVVNAAQAMPRGGAVTVRVRIEPREKIPWLVIEVCDEGLGLTHRATEKLFQPFFTTKATGTGLGLAVVKRIVESHGGEVSAKPNAERGTTFTVKIPGDSTKPNEGGSSRGST